MIPPQNVSETVYFREVAKRRATAQLIEAGWDQPKSRDFALVVLSCKRPVALSRCCHSLRSRFVESHLLSESWFVDNGSGPSVRSEMDVQGILGFRFTNEQWHTKNIGMGAALNDVLL